MTTKRIRGQLHSAAPYDPQRAGLAPGDPPRQRRYAWLNPVRLAIQLTCRHAWLSAPVAPVAGGAPSTLHRCPRCGLTGHG